MTIIWTKEIRIDREKRKRHSRLTHDSYVPLIKAALFPTEINSEA
jgi:hypothetical protein